MKYKCCFFSVITLFICLNFLVITPQQPAFNVITFNIAPNPINELNTLSDEGSAIGNISRAEQYIFANFQLLFGAELNEGK